MTYKQRNNPRKLEVIKDVLESLSPSCEKKKPQLPRSQDVALYLSCSSVQILVGRPDFESC